jgi:hypothetical protein
LGPEESHVESDDLDDWGAQEAQQMEGDGLNDEEMALYEQYESGIFQTCNLMEHTDICMPMMFLHLYMVILDVGELEDEEIDMEDALPESGLNL